MRQKLRILFLIGITVLAGTQEAMRQFDNLKSSLSELTRAGLWSGLIVYAQPGTDGNLPSPQIYYLIPQLQSAPEETAMHIDNRANGNRAVSKLTAKNNHAGEEAVLSTDVTAVAATHEVEDTAKPGSAIEKLPLNLVASNLLPQVPKLEMMHVYEEMAKHGAVTRKFKRDADDVPAGVFMKEFDAAQLEAELARLAVAQEQLGTSKLKSSIEPEKDAQRRIEYRVMRRTVHHERLKVLQPPATEKRVIALPDVSSSHCEKAATAKDVPAAVTAPSVTANVKVASEPLDIETTVRALSMTKSASWALDCDSETEQK